jgi:hypothetical protein
VAALVIIGDLVFVINTFLGGEITARFVLKALSVLAVAAVVFWYYLDDVRRAAPLKNGKYVALALAAVILAGIIGAFFIVGSPMQARLQQFDQQRVSDLQGIQSQVVNYWQRKGIMPQNLGDLTDSISGYTVPVDPQTKQPYQYMLEDPKELVFQLCANFNSKSGQDGMSPASVPAYPPGSIQNWDHPSGIYCFQRTIDQQLYPPINQPK